MGSDKHEKEVTGKKNRRCSMMILFFLFLLLVSADRLVAAEKKDASGINCNIHQGACTQELPGLKIILDIFPKPVKAMTDLFFRVTLSGKMPEIGPYIDLGMPGMKMGPNRVKLKPVGDGIYEGEGIIVKCPSGRRTWRTTVTVPGAGAADFIFDVVY